MKSCTQYQTDFGTLTNDSSATNKANGLTLINDSTRLICSLADWPFLKGTYSLNRTSGTQDYVLPANTDRVISVQVTVGSYKFTPEYVTSREDWDRINQTTVPQSDYPMYYWVQGNTLSFWPIPATTTTGAFTVTVRKRVVDLSIENYSTGTVTVTNASTTVTGSGTSWTSAMAGRWLKITPTSTADASGDGMWYQISSVASTTSLTLVQPYGGATVSSGTTYTMGEMNLLPEAFQELPLHRAIYMYFTTTQPETPRAAAFKTMFDEGLARLKLDQSGRGITPVLNRGFMGGDISPNPNLFPTSMS